MSTQSLETTVSAARHARAILFLPFTTTVVVPAMLLSAFPPSTSTPPHIGLAAAGIALLAAGVALAATALAAFVRLGNGTIAPWDPTRTLLATGVYARTRNPLKLGLFAILAAESLLARSWVLAAWLAGFAAANAVYIRVSEEPALRRRFGARYDAYCARVPRWWPKLRMAGSPTGTPEGPP